MALKIFSRAGVRKIFLTPCWGAWGMLPQKILKISVLRLAENAFPTGAFAGAFIQISFIPWYFL